jgi:predicted helicase
VEERRLSAASAGKKDSRALAPVTSDGEIFRALVKAGQRLAEIHVHYEQQPEYKLTQVGEKGEKLEERRS